MLVGKYQNSIDAKSRMIVPAKFREELGTKCVVSKALDHCLEIHPMEEWETFGGRLNPGALRRYSKKQQRNVSYEEWRKAYGRSD